MSNRAFILALLLVRIAIIGLGCLRDYAWALVFRVGHLRLKPVVFRVG